MKTEDVLITDLMKNISEGKIQLPAFQRDWIWDNDKICGLIASIISAYPIGAIMFLQCDNSSPLGFRPIEGVATNNKPADLILDGQQRLTSIFGAMYGGDKPLSVKGSKKNSAAKNFYYYIDIAKAVDIECDKTDAIFVFEEKKNKYKTAEAQFKNKMFPLNIIFDTDKISDWADEYKNSYKQDKKILAEYKAFNRDILSKLLQYKIPVILLEKETKMEAVCKVFEKINSKNQPLTNFDLVTAIFAKQDSKFELRQDWEKLKSKYFTKGILEKFTPEDFFRAFNLIVNYKKFVAGEKYNSGKMDISKLELADYKNYAKDLAQGFDDARKLLNEEGIVTEKNLP